MGFTIEPPTANSGSTHIWTASLGFPLLDESSVEFVYNIYSQVHPAPSFRDARIKADPEGKHHYIGQEWNLVLGLEEWEKLEIELVTGFFRAGPAFGPLSGEYSFATFLKFDYNF